MKRADGTANGTIVAFISVLLATSIAHAQETDDEAVSRSIADSIAIADSASPNQVKVHSRQLADSISVNEDSARNFHVFRSAFDVVSVGDISTTVGPSRISVSDTVDVSDSIAISGVIESRSLPIITVQSGPPLVLILDGDGVDDTVEIEFESSSSGSYLIQIRNAQGELTSSLTGSMVEGRNSVIWDGTSTSGDVVSAGTYTYHVTAQNEGGVRDPPQGGDGAIVVAGAHIAPSPLLGQIEYIAILAVIVVAGATAGLFIFFRRRKELVLYLPLAASEVIGEIQQKYPLAKVEDFVEPAQGGSKLYKGVKIANPSDDDEDWFTAVINKAKELAGVDSVNVSYRGKIRVV